MSSALIDRIFCLVRSWRWQGRRACSSHVLRELECPRQRDRSTSATTRTPTVEAPQRARHRTPSTSRSSTRGCEQRLAARGRRPRRSIDPRVRGQRPAYQPHRPLAVAARRERSGLGARPRRARPADARLRPLGRRTSADAMAERLGRPVKLLFLLRDGHLPLQVYRRRCSARTTCAPVELSRFTARRASFTDARPRCAAILAGQKAARPHRRSRPPARLCSQVEGAQAVRAASSASTARTRLRQGRAEPPQMLRKIVERSRAVRRHG